jgi:hypothetical protein
MREMARKLVRSLVLPVVGGKVFSLPVATPMTFTALPATSAGRFEPVNRSSLVKGPVRSV